MRFFVVAAEEENFQRAAARLNIAQSAISRRMRELEYELGGVRLFVPHGRGVQLTEGGRAFLRDARRLLAQAEEARLNAIAVERGTRPRLKIGYTAGLLLHGFFESVMISSFEALSPIVFETALLTPGMIVQQLGAERLDVGIIYADHVDEKFDFLDVAQEPYLLAVPEDHPFAGGADVAFEDVHGERLIWYARSLEPAMHTALLDAYRSHGAHPDIILESPTADTTLRWIRRGAGISFLPESAVDKDMPGVVLRPVRGFEMVLSFRVIWLRTHRSQMLERFLDTVRAHLPVISAKS